MLGHSDSDMGNLGINVLYACHIGNKQLVLGYNGPVNIGPYDQVLFAGFDKP